MGETVATLNDNGGISKPFETLDKTSRRFLVATRDITVETSIGDPFEDQTYPVKLGGHGPLKGGLLQSGGGSVSPPDAAVPLGDFDQVYVRNLMATLRGYPFWSPTLLPQPGIPVERARKGIIVGDVGYVRNSASFAVLFNIFQSADHPLNKGNVPDNFVPFRLNSSRYVAKRVFQNDSYIASPSVQVTHKEESDSGERSTVHFEANGPEGVILGLPCGATSEDLIDIPGLRQYIADNIFSWYVFLRKVLQRRRFNGDLRVVIGTDKSTAWSQALFVSLDGVSKDNFRVKFTAEKTAEGLVCNYQCSGTCYHVMGGPPGDFLEEIRDQNNISSNCYSQTSDHCSETLYHCSQTLFIRTLNPMLNDHHWEACQTGDNPPSAIIIMARRILTRAASRLPFFLKLMDWTRNSSMALRKLWPAKKDPKQKAIITGWLSPHVQADHPSNVLNKKLLQKVPDSKLVMTDDYDWLSCTTVDDNFAPNTLGTIADRVLGNRTIGNHKGVTFLSMQNPAIFS